MKDVIDLVDNISAITRWDNFDPEQRTSRWEINITSILNVSYNFLLSHLLANFKTVFDLINVQLHVEHRIECLNRYRSESWERDEVVSDLFLQSITISLPFQFEYINGLIIIKGNHGSIQA
jgi:hypothetical protein